MYPMYPMCLIILDVLHSKSPGWLRGPSHTGQLINFTGITGRLKRMVIILAP